MRQRPRLPEQDRFEVDRCYIVTNLLKRLVMWPERESSTFTFIGETHVVNNVDGGLDDRLQAEKQHFASRPQWGVVDVTLNALDVPFRRC